jgi:hypothetical protein
MDRQLPGLAFRISPQITGEKYCGGEVVALKEPSADLPLLPHKRGSDIPVVNVVMRVCVTVTRLVEAV